MADCGGNNKNCSDIKNILFLLTFVKFQNENVVGCLFFGTMTSKNLKCNAVQCDHCFFNPLNYLLSSCQI